VHYIDVYQFLKSRLTNVVVDSGSKRGSSTVEESEVEFEVAPEECESFDELTKHFFVKEGEDSHGYKLEHKPDMEQTLAAMLAVVLSTTATGGQLGLRVIGPPGCGKSTLAECISCCKKLVYARSKFTGIISGWSSIRKSQMIGNKINGMCVCIKDADTMLQMPNLAQVESEIRDAMGDGVIRADYRTGREFNIRTLFTMIQCGTDVLKGLDNALLGARFLDIYVLPRDADTQGIVRRAIKSQFQTIRKQLSGGVSTSIQQETRQKEQIIKLAPYAVGFLLHKRQQIEDGIQFKEPDDELENRIYAMAELASFLRARVHRDQDGSLKSRPFRETATRVGEQLIRLAMFAGIVFAKPGQHPTIGKREFALVSKVLNDTADSYPWEILRYLREHRKADSNEIGIHLGISQASAFNVLKDMRSLKIIETDTVTNGTGSGRGRQLYSLTSTVTNLADAAGI